MNIFYYTHTGHRIGLDRFRRAAAIIECIKGDFDITLLTSDYRIASIARDFGIEKSVGIDVVRNIANIAERGDKLIFDSEEANPLMLEDMRNYFSSFVRISDDPNTQKDPKECLIDPYMEAEDGVCSAVAVSSKFFKTFEKDVAMSFFWGDDDYEKDLETHLDLLKDKEVSLQLGFYYFVDYEAKLQKLFPDYFEFDEYDEMIKRTDILITASPQSVLESLASGGRPIYLQREDYPSYHIPLFEKLGIPVVLDYEKDKLDRYIDAIKNNSYNNYKKIENNCYKIAPFLKKCLL